jgi:Icc-related predicted phosphoesterase
MRSAYYTEHVRVLVVADLPAWENSELLEAAATADCIVSLGDLEIDELAPLLRPEIVVPHICVRGNHDGDEETGFVDTHLKRGSVNGHVFGGFEGCLRYKNFGFHQYTQEEATALLADFPAVDVMISHSPPLGVHDDVEAPHIGFEALRDYCERHQPAYLLHGHTYPDEAEPGPPAIGESLSCRSRLGETEVIYVYGAALLELF